MLRVEKVEKGYFLMEVKNLNLKKENLNTGIDILVIILSLAKKLFGEMKK
jgi:hypothetical protein